MLLKDNRNRALKGFLYNNMIDSKVLYVIAGSILFGYLLLTTLLSISSISYGMSSNSNGGTLNIGFMTTCISMFIVAIVMAVGKEKKNHFVFPIDRLTYTIGNFVTFALNTAGLLVLASAAYIVEVTVFSILSKIFDKVIFSHNTTPETYLLGLWTSFWYIMLLTTITYFIFMIFARFKLIGIIIFCVVFISLLSFAMGRYFLSCLLGFFVQEQSPLLFSLKLIVSVLVLQALSYLPLRNMEVNV